jgi:phosphatidylethanolamine/phosphatidyl-N-methylethanolamine N-methyltransferase
MRDAALLFWRQYLKRPLGVGALAPSSPQLARAVVDALDPRTDEIVVELGPGTGAFTRQLIREGVSPRNLVLVELDPHFARYLRQQFPEVTLIEGNAAKLATILRGLGHGRVKRILSGLPLRSMSPRDRRRVTRACAASLERGGVLVQFSYLHLPPLPERLCAKLGLMPRRAGVVLSNIPPAVVWRYTKL